MADKNNNNDPFSQFETATSTPSSDAFADFEGVSSPSVTEPQPIPQVNELNFQPKIVGQSNPIATQTGGLFSGFELPNPEGSLVSSFVTGVKAPFDIAGTGGGLILKKIEDVTGLKTPFLWRSFVGANKEVAEAIGTPKAPPADTLPGAIVESIPGLIVGEGLPKLLTPQATQAFSQALKVALPETTEALHGPASTEISNQLQKMMGEASRLRYLGSESFEEFNTMSAKAIDKVAQQTAIIEDQAANSSAKIAQNVSKVQEELTQLRQQKALGLVDDLNFGPKEQELETTLSNLENQRNQAKVSFNKKLQQQSNKLDTDLRALQDKYGMDVSRLDTDNPELRKTISERLKENLHQQEQLVQTMQELKLKAPNPESFITPSISKEAAVDAGMEQVKKINQLVKEGKIDPEMAHFLKKQEMENALHLYGFDPGTIDKTPNRLGFLTNWSTDLNIMQKKTGVPVARTASTLFQNENLMSHFIADEYSNLQQLGQKLNKLGYSDSEILRKLQYVGDAGYDPTALKLVRLKNGDLVPWTPELEGLPTPVNIPADHLPGITPEAAEVFQQIRQKWDQLGNIFGVEQKLPRYVPQMTLPSGPKLSSGTTAEAIQTAGFTKMRQDGGLIPGVHDTSFNSVALKYLRQGAKQNFIGPVLESAIQDYNALKLLGSTENAERLKKFIVNGFNLKNEAAIPKLFADHVIETSPVIKEALKIVPDQESFLSELYRTIRKVFYQNTIGSSPVTLTGQLLQPRVMGYSELGHYIEKAYIVDRLPTASAQNLKRLAAKIAKGSTQAEIVGPTKDSANYAVNKFLNWINKPTEFTLKHGMGKGEFLNRRVSALAGLLKWDVAAAKNTIPEILKDLTTAERSVIQKAYSNAGNEGARQAYALVKTNRVNLIYNPSNKASILQNDIGKTIDFTSFARGLLSNYVEALSEGQYSKAAKMFTTHFGVAVAVGALLGKKYGGNDPATEISNLFTRLQPAPAITGPITTAVQKGPAAGLEKAAENVLAPVRIYKQSKKYLGSQ